MAEKTIFFVFGILSTVLGMVIKDIILKKKMTIYQTRLEFYQKFWLEFSKLHQTYLALEITYCKELVPELRSINKNCSELRSSYSILLSSNILKLLSEYEREIYGATSIYGRLEKGIQPEKEEDIRKTINRIFGKIESAVRRELLGGRLFSHIFKMGY